LIPIDSIDYIDSTITFTASIKTVNLIIQKYLQLPQLF